MSDVIEKALEVFAKGFCFTRSFTHPFVAQRVESGWAVQDGPRRSGAYRCEEFIFHGVPAKEMDRLARASARGRFGICAICAQGEPDAEMRAEFKRLGYRLQTTEALMVHGLEKVPRVETPAEIVRVTTQEDADRLAKAARRRQILPEHLNDGAALRQYAAIVDGKMVGWVRSILVGDATWCSNMFVERTFRRRGIGKGLLARMLKEDRGRGARRAILLASYAGAQLYPVVGYARVGTLYMFKPRKLLG